MSLSSSYNCTLKASYAGYVVQAIVNNFAPLLFLTFQDTFGIKASPASPAAAKTWAATIQVR